MSVKPPLIARRGDSVHIFRGGEVTQVSVSRPGVASIIRCPLGRLPQARGFFIDAGRTETLAFEDGRDELCLVGPGMIIAVSKADGKLQFRAPDGRPLLQEAGVPEPIPGFSASRREGFTIGSQERLYGLGQFREPLSEYRDRDVFLAHANSDAVNPFLISTSGWGLLWDTGTAAYLRSRGNGLAFHSVAGDVVRYHVCVGTDMDDVIGRYRALTGAASLLPRWAYGYWQSKESYARQVDLIAVVDEYRRRRLPLDTIVLDFRYWGAATNFSGMQFDRKSFPDPKAMLDHVHARDVHLLASIWPAFGVDTDLYHEMSAAGYLLPSEHWSGGKVFDVSNPKARAIYWRHIKAGLIDIGVDGLWTDGNEPELRSTGERYGTAASYAANGRIAAGPVEENLLTYSWYQASGLSEALRRDVPQKRPIILSRSAYAGQQTFGAITWSGDIFASWGTLGNQIVAALNFVMAGIPWWTCDIGAFLVFHRYPDGLADPAYKELYVRWFQFGAFLPIFRAHGTHVPREIWQFGNPGDPYYDALESALRQRYALLPYIYSLAAATALQGDTLIRAMVMDYPDQPVVRDQAATFMFGRDLLVRIVDRPMYHPSRNAQEFIPSYAISGDQKPAATIAYFEGANFDRFISSRLTDDIKMSWAGDLPAALAGKPYSVRWTGRIVALESGAHRFSVIGKGALKLVFDGRLVVDGRSHASTADNADGGVSFRGHEGDAFFTFDADLVSGRGYDFALEQQQETPDAVSLWFEWITPAIRARQELPADKSVLINLPAGRDWFDFESGQRYDGGQTVSVTADLARTPVFARAGAVVPLSGGLDRTGPLPKAIDLRVYAGHDGEFTLYDDSGDGHGYLEGEHAQVRIIWHNASSTLTVGERVGRYPGMRSELRLNVIVIRGKNIRLERAIDYIGVQKTVYMT